MSTAGRVMAVPPPAGSATFHTQLAVVHPQLAMGPHWRDWIGDPDALNALWPQLFASELPPSSWRGLLATCRFTRDATLRAAPRAKLTLRLSPPPPDEATSAGPLLTPPTANTPAPAGSPTANTPASVDPLLFAPTPAPAGPQLFAPTANTPAPADPLLFAPTPPPAGPLLFAAAASTPASVDFKLFAPTPPPAGPQLFAATANTPASADSQVFAPTPPPAGPQLFAATASTPASASPLLFAPTPPPPGPPPAPPAANPPAPAGPLVLLQASGRTQPTTLALLNTPAAAAAPAAPPLTTRAAKQQARLILNLPAVQGSLAITRLHLDGVVVSNSLLEALQGLPSLTHLDLTHVEVPSTTYVYEGQRFPGDLRTLNLQPNDLATATVAPYTSLLFEFLAQDSITELRLANACALPRYNLQHQRVLDGVMVAVVSLGISVRALRRLCVPGVALDDDMATVLRQATPLLEELEVMSTHMWSLDADQDLAEVTWRTLRVTDLCVDGCRGLPLGGTAGDLDIHVKRSLCAMDTDLVDEGILNLMTEATRRVRLVGSGGDGSAFAWDSCQCNDGNGENVRLQNVLPLLQISKRPVTRLELLNLKTLSPEDLAAALAPLPTVTRLKIQLHNWKDGMHRRSRDQLLSLLPLSINLVCLTGECDAVDLKGVFEGMLVEASKVSRRRGHPLRVCLVPVSPVSGEAYEELLGPRSGLWCVVERCREQGDMGVMLVEYWD